MTILELLSAVASVATAVGVCVAAYQLIAVHRQGVTTFEDAITGQYRAIIATLPIEALFGEPLQPETQTGLLPHFYRYFDLCNEQAFLFRHGRVSAKTWRHWEEGILTNMQRPAFAAAWADVARRATDDFNELRTLCPPTTAGTNQHADA